MFYVHTTSSHRLKVSAWPNKVTTSLCLSFFFSCVAKLCCVGHQVWNKLRQEETKTRHSSKAKVLHILVKEVTVLQQKGPVILLGQSTVRLMEILRRSSLLVAQINSSSWSLFICNFAVDFYCINNIKSLKMEDRFPCFAIQRCLGMVLNGM